MGKENTTKNPTTEKNETTPPDLATTKPEKVKTPTPSLQFIPPALRVKALSQAPAKPKNYPKTTPRISSSVVPRQIASANPQAIEIVSVMLDDVEDEYNPLKPNEYSDYKEILKQKRKEKKWQQKEHDKMLSILHDVASGTSLDKVEKQEDFGVRIMRKFGWKDGQGLGKDSQGISVPLIAKRTSDQGGIIVNTDHKFQHSLSTVLLLENMTDKLDAELESEVKGECSNFGEVINVIGATGFDSKIRIFVEFSTHNEAKKGLEILDGRFFGGRQITATLYPLANYKRRE